jgi:hypothetical protein
MLLAALAALTVGLVLGIKFFLGEDAPATQEPPPDQGQLFSTQAADKPPEGLRTAADPVSGGSSGLDMFSKTNAGYYGEEGSTEAAAAQTGAAPEVTKSSATAVKKGANTAKPKATVIPRMKQSSLGGITPSNVTPGGQGQMPDISSILKQAQRSNNNSSGD